MNMQVVDNFKEEYIRQLEATDPTWAWAKRKRVAFDAAAASAIPDAKERVTAHANVMQGKRQSDEFSKSGHAIALSMARGVTSKFGHQIARKRAEKEQIKWQAEEVSESAWQLYSWWATENDFLPSDDAIAHFSGISSTMFSRARNRLLDEGYEFQRIANDRDKRSTNGWNIVTRPSNFAGLTTEESIVMKALLAKLIAKGQPNPSWGQPSQAPATAKPNRQ